MDYLEHLDLGHNELSGSIPATIGNAGRLTGIDLGSNRLSGSIPATIGSAGRLTAIDLGSNRLTGRIPAELGNLRNLVELDLGNDEDLVAAGPAGYAAQTTGPSGQRAFGFDPAGTGTTHPAWNCWTCPGTRCPAGSRGNWVSSRRWRR